MSLALILVIAGAAVLAVPVLLHRDQDHEVRGAVVDTGSEFAFRWRIVQRLKAGISEPLGSADFDPYLDVDRFGRRHDYRSRLEPNR